MQYPDSLKIDKEKRILCVGLLCLDIVAVCESYPKEGTDQNCKRMQWQKGGNAANTSGVLGILKQKVDYFGTVTNCLHNPSNNVAWELTESEMKGYGVCMDKVVVHSEYVFPCTQVIINSCNGSRTILHFGKLLPELTLEDFKQLNLSIYSLIHFEGRNLEEVIKMINHVHTFNETVANRQKKIVISVELEKSNRPNLHLLFPVADLVSVSQDYAESFGHKNAMDAVKAFKDKTKPGAFVVCAWGDSGAASGVAGNEDDIVMTPAFVPNQVVDTLGAGDTFLGGLIHALVCGANLTQSVRFACHIAGHKVASYGYNCIREACHEIHDI